MPLPRRSYYQRNGTQSWSSSRPAYSHWSSPQPQWQESCWSHGQGWGSGWQHASQPWYPAPWEKAMRRQMHRQEKRPERREGRERKYQQAFVPPDARPVRTTSPAARCNPQPQAPEPVEPQLQITPPCPDNATNPATPRTINVFSLLQAEGLDVSPPKRHKTLEKRKAAEQQEGSSPKKPKQAWWKPNKLFQVLNDADKNGVVAQDMGVRLCPSFLPKRGVSRNHSGSQLCSSARCDPHIWLCCGDVLQSTSLAIHQRGITRTAPEPELIPCIPGPASHHDEHWDGRRAQHNWS